MKKVLFLFLVLFLSACGDDEAGPDSPQDNFDRQAMLVNWADNIIIPAYTAFATKTTALNTDANAFVSDPTPENYQNLVASWEEAYLHFQEVSMFEIGKAEELRFTNNLNIYPTDVSLITENILSGDYNLELPSQITTQGFPAIDYLLFGLGNDESSILDFYQNDLNATKYLEYLQALTARINSLTQTILADWNSDYRTNFVENSGNSAISSVDKLVNDYIFYYERHLRAGKIGIPAGVFSTSSLPENVEAFYKKELSKVLFNRALNTVQDFFNGTHYDGTASGESMKTYLDYLEVTKNEVNLSQVINEQFDTARATAQELADDFAMQVASDNLKMLETYDQLQLNVVHLKVDMLQAFNINVDFVDADGD